LKLSENIKKIDCLKSKKTMKFIQPIRNQKMLAQTVVLKL
jgi:hypothetical protein